jgi:hypothetical protein
VRCPESGWKQLIQRRQENRRIILHKGLNGYANIPISDINQNKRKQRKGHNQQFQISDSEFLSYNLMLKSGKKIRAERDKKKYSNSCVVRKKNSVRNKKP